MKTKNTLLLLISFTIFIFCSCGKNKNVIVGEDPSNHDLLKKPLAQIKAEIAGRWQVKRSRFEATGVVGITIKDSIYSNNTGDLISFLTNDTVKQIDYNQIYTKIYEKADITKKAAGYGTYNGFPWNVDSVYVYNFNNAIFSSFAMIEIKNDTLVTYGAPIFTTLYLTRKP
jgi:hypothetical protein